MHSKRKWMIGLGMVLIFCSLALMLFTTFYADYAKQKSENVVKGLEKIMPPKSVGTEDVYSSMQMPSLEFDGVDFIGILEIPEHNLKLPIAETWNAKTLISFPQRFAGTTYDASLIIGGFDQDAQFDCLKKLDIGNRVVVTDMTGAQFSYEVKLIERKDSAQAEVLEDAEFRLTLFVRDINSMKYIIVRCI